MNIRQATEDDISEIYQLIIELAEYEKGLDQVTNTTERLVSDFNKHLYNCLVADEQGRVVGMSLYYYRYSTWKGKILYLEDLVVKEAFRGHGIGKQLLDATIAIAKQTNSRGLRWQVLDWNTPAINFYKKYNADFDSGWLNVDMSL